MTLFKSAALSACFVAFGITTAQAATITVDDYSQAKVDAAYVGVNESVVEDFEKLSTTETQIDTDGGFDLAVGTVETIGGRGTGSSVIGDGRDLSLRTGNNYGRTNTTPNGNWFLDSNDTWGMKFEVAALFDFNRIFFSLTDAADQNARVMIEQSESATYFDEIVDFKNGNRKLVTIDLDAFIVSPGSLTVTVSNLTRRGRNASGIIYKKNDGYGVDDFTVAAVGINPANEPEPVPLPAAGVLLLTALGGLGLARRRAAKKSS